MAGRYPSKSCIFNGIRFDSISEMHCYSWILRHFPADQVEVHKDLEIIPESDEFKGRSWKVDFYIKPINLWVEYKGEKLLKDDERFKWNLVAVKTFVPEVYDRLIVVSGDRVRYSKKRYTHTLQSLDNLLGTLK